MASLSPSPKLKFFTNANTPAAGYRLYTYQANTTTPQVTYADPDGLTPNTNPIVLDSRGEATIYLSSGQSYDYVLKTAEDAIEWGPILVSPPEGTGALPDGGAVGQVLAKTSSGPAWQDAPSDTALRTDLTTTASGKGAEMVKYKVAANAVDRDLLRKAQEIPSLFDFGAAGDGTTDDKAAFDKAEASSFKRIEVPAGHTFYTTSTATQLTKRYVGDGKIKLSTGPTQIPGNYVSITTRPATGTGSDYDKFFSADLSKVSAAHYRIGSYTANIRKGLNEPYFESCTTPRFHWTTNHSGWSGTTAMFDDPASAGATAIKLNSVEGVSNGDVLGLSGGASDPSYLSFTDTVTVTNVNADTRTVTFTPALSTSYPGSGPTAGRATHGARTMNPVEHCNFTHLGGGDAYGYLVRGVAGYTPLAGQNHVFFGSTIGVIGGDLSAATAGNFLTGIEIDHRDNGLASGCVGLILNFQRTADRGIRGETWTCVKLKSEGGTPMDTVLTFAGTAKMGIDLTLGDFGANKRAIGLKAGDVIGFNDTALADSSGIYTQNGTPKSDGTQVTLGYESATASLHLTNAQITGTGLHNHATGMNSKTVGYVGSNSNTYNPSIVAISNTTSATHYNYGMFVRVGNLVMVSGRFDHQAAAAGAFALKFNPPIPSTFTLGRQASGTAISDNQSGLVGHAQMLSTAGAGDNRLLFQGVAPDTLIRTYSYHGIYEVA